MAAGSSDACRALGGFDILLESKSSYTVVKCQDSPIHTPVLSADTGEG